MSEYLVEDGTADRIAAVEPQLLRVFLATPSLRLTGPADGVFPLALRARVTALREALLNSGVRVFSSHHDQSWVARGVAESPRVPSTHRAVMTADVVVACVGSPLSSGVALELGWASAMRKPIILLVDRAVEHNPLVESLEEVCPVFPLAYDNSWSATALQQILVTALDWADHTIWPSADEMGATSTVTS
jgi:nucleoside 2-deoxyribosyltransferase